MYGLTISNYFLYQNSKVSFKPIVTILSTVYRVKRFTEKTKEVKLLTISHRVF